MSSRTGTLSEIRSATCTISIFFLTPIFFIDHNLYHYHRILYFFVCLPFLWRFRCLFSNAEQRNSLIPEWSVNDFPGISSFNRKLIPVFQFLIVCSGFLLSEEHIILKFKHHEILLLQKQQTRIKRKSFTLGCLH